MDYWLKVLGGGLRGQALRDDWQNERRGLLLRAATFNRRSGIRPGDGIVYYAAGRRLVFAAGEATSLPFDSADGTDWPWRVKVSIRWKVELIGDGVPLDYLNVRKRSG